MEIVADHLEQQAMTRSVSSERDSFGRSAFNRYYYATFLQVKSGLAELRPEWAGDMAHAKIPEMLRGTICSDLKKGHQKALRTSDHEVVVLCSRAVSAAKELAKLMDEGRATRVTADYHPEIPVSFSTGVRFRLNSVGVDAARIWPHRARALVADIQSAWRQINA
jgi:hypothetical protein